MNALGMTFVLAILLSAISTMADEAKTVQFEGTDITAFVEHFRSAVKTLTKPVTIYNWSSGGAQPFWDHDRGQVDPALTALAQSQSRSFWQNYGSPEGGQNSYGFGLYGAVDPVITFGFGGGGSNWVLLQMEMPVGFKMIDVGLSVARIGAIKSTSTDFQKIARQFQCPETGQLEPLFVFGGKDLNPDCRRLVKKVFADILKIDGFAYFYTRKTFKACQNENSYLNIRAFVMTNPDWIRPEYIRFYTEKSRSDLEGRIRIQTLFFGAIDLGITDAALGKISDYLAKKPDHYVSSSVTKCSNAACVITVHFCDDEKNCEDVDLDPLPRPGGPVITATEALKTAATKLLWSDLEGQPKQATIKTWVRENLYGCSGELPFAEVAK